MFLELPMSAIMEGGSSVAISDKSQSEEKNGKTLFFNAIAITNYGLILY
jgi:hypothetical protein